MTTGRTCGVMIEPLAAENGCSMSLTQVETPLPYGGDFTGAMATVTSMGPPNGNGLAACAINSLCHQPSAISVPLHPGDQIQVGYQGYRMPDRPGQYPAGTNDDYPASLDCSHGETPAWLSQPITGPYKIWRWPTKSVSAALQLPTPACIDLTWSGIEPVVAGQVADLASSPARR